MSSPKSKWKNRDSKSLRVAASAEQPVSWMAELILGRLLKEVRALLRPDVWSAENTVRQVHQLRVATRRASAALDCFRDSLPQKKRRTFARRLKRLRRAAGPVRDLDVLKLRLLAGANDTPANENSGSGGEDRIDLVLSALEQHRRQALRRLKRAVRRVRANDFRGDCKRLLSKVRWRGAHSEPTFQEAARRALSEAAEKFLCAGAEESSSGEALHEFRLAGKRLRYTLELLRGAFPRTAAREVLSAVREIQDRLGAANDHLAARQLMHNWANHCEFLESQSQFDRLIVQEERAHEQARQEFEAWWTAERREAVQTQLESLLSPRSL